MQRLTRTLLVGVAAACGENAATDPANRLLATDSSSYTAMSVGYDQVMVRVVTRYRNSTSAPIELLRCFPDTPYPTYDVVLISPASSDGAGYSPSWACVGHNNPIIVVPGEVRTDTLTLRGPNGYDNASKRYLGVMAGQFRIDYGGQTSNAFTIKLPPEGIVPYVPRDLSAAIQTDSLIVRLRRDDVVYRARAPIGITIHNPRPDTSFIPNCNRQTGLLLEKQSGSQWVTAWGAVIPSCASPDIVIPPNGNYETVIDLLGVPKGANGVPRFTVDNIPGIYRFVWTQIVDSRTVLTQTPGRVIPIAYRRSNAFAIVTAP